MFGFGKGKKDKEVDEDEVFDEGRRNFLKGAAVTIPVGVAGVVVMASGVQAGESNSVKSDYLKKTWVEDGITYMQYELPSNVQPFFKHPDGRGRAISTPIYNLDKEHFNHTESYDEPQKWVWTKDQRKAKFLDKMVNYIRMGQNQDAEGWATPYCYIVCIKGNDNLFGAMINQKKLEFETDVYTVYAGD